MKADNITDNPLIKLRIDSFARRESGLVPSKSDDMDFDLCEIKRSFK